MFSFSDRILRVLKSRELLRRLVARAVAKTAATSNRRAIISFTFDDFPRSAVSNGARILESHGARGTFYAAGAYCGETVDGIVQYSKEDLSAVVRARHEIGCHTFHHRRVSTLTAKELQSEIDLNCEFFASCSPHTKMRTFAYPYGDLSLRGTIKLQGMFDTCRSTETGLNVGKVDLGRLRAIRLYSSRIDAGGVRELIREAVARKAWLIFYTHDVDPAPSEFGCTPELFEEAVKLASSVDAEVLPVSEAMTKVCRGDE
jgi:peptidoglycan/xylan/chitin deacetylase (PgdA/CDA1 family)